MQDTVPRYSAIRYLQPLREGGSLPAVVVWDRRPWLIDHGGALYAHHHWAAVDEARTRTAFPRITGSRRRAPTSCRARRSTAGSRPTPPASWRRSSRAPGVTGPAAPSSERARRSADGTSRDFAVHFPA
jgi:hypothetical protein